MNLLARLGRRTVKILAILLAVIVGLEVVYLVVGNVMLRAGTVERLLNKRPEKTLVRYESAYTLFPGHAVVKGFKIRSQATRSQIEAQGDRVSALVNPLPLLWKTVHIVRADVRGAEFRMRRRPVTPEELKDKQAFVPPIEGLDYKDSLRDPNAVPKAPKWGVSITSSRVDDVRQVWIDDYKLTGPGSAGGGMSIGPGRWLELDGAWADFPALQAAAGGKPFLVDAMLKARVDITRYDYGENKGLKFRPYLSGRVELEATSPGGSPLLNHLFRHVKWLSFDGTERRAAADLTIEKGTLQPGSWLKMTTDDLAVNFLVYRAEGKADVGVKVLEGQKNRLLDVEVVLQDFGVGLASSTPDAAVGKRLRLHAVTDDDLIGEKVPEGDLELELEDVYAKDLTRANYLIPAGAGVRFRAGSARLDARLKAATHGSTGEGKVTLATEGMALDAGALAMTGKLEAAVPISRGDMMAQRFAIDGMAIKLSDFDVAGTTAEGKTTQDWWAELDAPRGLFGFKDPEMFRGDLTFKMRDSAPLVQFMTARKPLPKIGERILEVENVAGKAGLVYGADRIEIRDLLVSSDMIELQANLAIQGKSARGDLLAVYDWIGVGVEMKGTKQDFHLTGARRWYESRHPGAAPDQSRVAAKKEKAEKEEKRAAEEKEKAAEKAAEKQPEGEKKPNWFQRNFSKKK
jgi:hypothetical protein